MPLVSLFYCARGLSLGLEFLRPSYTMRRVMFSGMTQLGEGFARLESSVIDSLCRSQTGGTFSPSPMPRRTGETYSWGNIQEFASSG